MADTVTTTNLIQGPADLYQGLFGATEPANTAVNSAPSASAWTGLGGTMGGVDLEVKQSYKELEVDQLVDVPGRRMVKREVSLKTKLAEVTLEHILLAINSASAGIETGSGFRSLEPDDSSSATQPAYWALIMDGYAPDSKRRRVIGRKMLSVEGAKTGASKEGQTTLDVTFAAHYVSSSVKPFRIVDEVAA